MTNLAVTNDLFFERTGMNPRRVERNGDEQERRNEDVQDEESHENRPEAESVLFEENLEHPSPDRVDRSIRTHISPIFFSPKIFAHPRINPIAMSRMMEAIAAASGYCCPLTALSIRLAISVPLPSVGPPRI